jgi:hypothetical protein
MADNSNNGNNPVAGVSGLNQQNVQQQQAVQGNDGAARQIQANTNVTMKTEVIKLPDFYGEPGKDTIAALEFMARIDECQVTNEWNNMTTFSYFRLALRGQADKWLSSIIRNLHLTAAQKTWTCIRRPNSGQFSKQNLLLSQTTNLSLLDSPNFHTGQTKIHKCFSHIWKN